MQELKNLYNMVEQVNEILSRHVDTWTQEEKDLVTWWTTSKSGGIGVGAGVGGYYWPKYEDLETTCQHEWEEKALLTSVYRVCRLCGEEE